MAANYPEVEDQEGTRIEKVLIASLVAFLLVGGFWALSRIEASFPEPTLQGYGNDNQQGASTVSIEDELGVTPFRSQVQRLELVASNRKATLDKAKAAQQKANEDYKFRREEYRTAMQAGRVSSDQKTAFESTRATYQKLTDAVAPAQAGSDTAAKNLADEQSKLDTASRKAQDVYDSRILQRNIKILGVTFGFAALCLGGSWMLWQLGRKKRWRYQAILSALFIASVLQLLFLLFRYCWAFFLEDTAYLGISVLGSVVCILAIIAIKRWLYSPMRLAQARLGAHRCPHCATAFYESQNHCWQCGAALLEKCPSCGANRLLLAPHCGNCGIATAPDANQKAEV